MEISVPYAYHAISVRQFTDYMTAADDVERLMAIGQITRSQAKMINARSAQLILDTFESVIAEPTGEHRRVIKIGDTDFGFIPSFDDITFAEHADLSALSEAIWSKSQWKHLPLFLAICYRPITLKIGKAYEIEPYDSDKAKEKAAIISRSLNMADAEGVSLFFSTILRECVIDGSARMMKKMMTEMKKSLQIIDEEMQNKPSPESGHGITS